MKKLIAIALVLTLVLSMGAFAFAVDVNNGTIAIEKNYKLINEGTVSPAETFNFTITSYLETEYGNAVPEFGSGGAFSIPFNQSDATLADAIKSGTITLPNYTKVGVYTYLVNETLGSTAGVKYDTRQLLLKVYVINGVGGLEVGGVALREVTFENDVAIEGDKVTGFENEFSAGNLSIYKAVTGNMGEMDRYFDVTVTLTGPTDKQMASVPVTIGGGSSAENPTTVTFTANEATVNLKIKHDETITIENLPYGVTYTVEETAPGYGYDTPLYEFSDEGENKLIDNGSETVEITNNKETQINTGINLDNLPYVLILVGAAAGLVAFTIKKRPSRDE